jgi:hypothetical protein
MYRAPYARSAGRGLARCTPTRLRPATASRSQPRTQPSALVTHLQADAALPEAAVQHPCAAHGSAKWRARVLTCSMGADDAAPITWQHRRRAVLLQGWFRQHPRLRTAGARWSQSYAQPAAHVLLILRCRMSFMPYQVHRYALALSGSYFQYLAIIHLSEPGNACHIRPSSLLPTRR